MQVLAIENLRYAAGKGTPFFIGMGVFKPHYPVSDPTRRRCQSVSLCSTSLIAPILLVCICAPPLPLPTTTSTRNPHRPEHPVQWHVPQQFVDMYHQDSMAVPTHPLFPPGAPSWAFDHGLDGVQTFELLNTSAADGLAHIPVPSIGSTAPMPTWVYKAMRRGYFSAMSWSDHLVGMMLDEIDALGLTNTTLVVLTADHGYHLGELGLGKAVAL